MTIETRKQFIAMMQCCVRSIKSGKCPHNCLVCDINKYQIQKLAEENKN